MITEALIAKAIEAHRGDLEHHRNAAASSGALCQDVLDERGMRSTGDRALPSALTAVAGALGSRLIPSECVAGRRCRGVGVRFRTNEVG